MVSLGRLCGLMPASNVVTGDKTVIPDLLVGLDLDEGASSVLNCVYVVTDSAAVFGNKR